MDTGIHAPKEDSTTVQPCIHCAVSNQHLNGLINFVSLLCRSSAGKTSNVPSQPHQVVVPAHPGIQQQSILL